QLDAEHGAHERVDVDAVHRLELEFPGSAVANDFAALRALRLFVPLHLARVPFALQIWVERVADRLEVNPPYEPAVDGMPHGFRNLLVHFRGFRCVTQGDEGTGGRPGISALPDALLRVRHELG